MNIETLMPITQKVIAVLKAHEIEEEEYLTVLHNIINEVKNNIEVKVTIEDTCFNLLRDMIWYNLERTNDNDTLSDWGTKYPLFMNLCELNNYIESSDFFGLNKELTDIKNQLSTFNTILLIGNEALFDINTHVYFPQINTKTNNSITCMVKENLNKDEMMKIKVESLINNLIEAINNANDKKAKIHITFI